MSRFVSAPHGQRCSVSDFPRERESGGPSTWPISEFDGRAFLVVCGRCYTALRAEAGSNQYHNSFTVRRGSP